LWLAGIRLARRQHCVIAAELPFYHEREQYKEKDAEPYEKNILGRNRWPLSLMHQGLSVEEPSRPLIDEVESKRKSAVS
jgi:hypothetical protein